MAAALVVAGIAAPGRADIALSLYGDVGGEVQTTGTRSGTLASFSAAKLEFFTTASAGNWSLLAETLFEVGDDNEFGIDVERLQVNYLYRDWLRLAVGRFHTAIGYYNDGFHHGAFFMPGVARPRIVRFEDDGGLIAAHSVGVHIDGRLPAGEAHLRYDIDLGNGRAADGGTVQNGHDTNRPKSLNVRLRYEPGGTLEGLILGANLYFDSIPATAAGATAAPHGPLREWLTGVHAAYLEHGIHAVVELYAIDHHELDGDVGHWTYAGFAEAGRAFGDVLPFVRYEYTRHPAGGDSLYGATEADGYQAIEVGAKHSTSENIALKLEAGVLFPQASGADAVFALTGQIAFAF